MKIEDVKVGETYEAVGAPSSKLLVSGKGHTMVCGYWQHHSLPRQEATYQPQNLRPVVKRYVVEIRAPKAGEKFIAPHLADGPIKVAEPGEVDRPVIVEEL